MPTRSPTMPEALEEWRNGILRDLRVALPARVLSYDAANQLASVKPEIQDYFFNEDDSVTNIPLPVLTNVPVLWQAGGGYAATFPLAPGDKVQLLISDRSLDSWLSMGTEQAPIDQRRHNIKDAVAIPGLHDNQHPIPAVATDGAVFGFNGGVQVKVTSSQIKLGRSATESAINGDTYITAELSALTALIAALTAIAAAITNTGALTANGPAANAACTAAVGALNVFASEASTFKSTTVKVQP